MSNVWGSSNAFHNGDAPIKILLADDSEIMRRGIRLLLASHAEIEIVGEAANFAQTIQMTNGLNPQVVILDLHMPDQKTISLQDVKSHLNRRSQVLAISVWNDEESRELAETFGAAVLLDKTDLGNRLITTIMQLSRERCASA